MPLYEYQCRQCGFRFEALQKVNDTPLETCKSCGGKLVKLISSPAIQFKGSGWYITDYAAKKRPADKETLPVKAPKDEPKKGPKETAPTTS
jgi:putative FmdB family regulatory protein